MPTERQIAGNEAANSHSRVCVHVFKIGKNDYTRKNIYL